MVSKIVEKIGSGGVWFAALSCTACFPALGSLSSALGLGFLSHFEAIAVNTLLPLFASIALLANLYNWFKHKNTTRGLVSVLGPIAVLLTLYPLWQYGWSNYLFYFGITLMISISVLDIVKPARKPTCHI
ncbi:organomercurial transporter MerC [Pseudoalteromonas sp. T1lg23B]|uniref:organomercurial transporter MerC n=1 Tax=Pseudoalteromonas sp. T1lg23B TaxID=2077097 RepID=UPI000CF6173B|nr:organomercurial transporter MerC [Pseudoalteromonas sp. T1lg23B]